MGGKMSNDVADCPYCDDGLITDGYGDTHCDRCGRLVEYSFELGFGARIDNNRYRRRIGMEELEE